MTTRSSAPPLDDPLVAELADVMARRWDRGDRVAAEEFLARHPELGQSPPRAIRLIYAEICLRQEHGLGVVADDFLRRFPEWRRQLTLMLECHELLEGAPPPPRLPGVGDTIAGYQLLSALGDGASGRVFLARQPALADRPVVVKITWLRGQEHWHLARLQHTHIVPLYAVHDEPARDLRLLCMPYFGGATLDRVLHALADRPRQQWSGACWLDAVRSPRVECVGPARPILERLGHVEAVCWVGACLAEALHYAHQGGLIHLDIKPANVLIAADGQPMLLDFHLARAPLACGTVPPDGIGGTAGYMPPEQEQAMTAAARGRPIPYPLDHRADIFALGTVLIEALGGPVPFVPAQSQPICRQNPLISSGLADVLARCLAPDASDRYHDAALLADDLRRHLADLPLRGVGNRSWRERFKKWRRRSPAASRAALWAMALLPCLVAPTVTWIAPWHQGMDSSVQQPPAEVLHAEQSQAAAKQRRLAAELHRLADRVRLVQGAETVPMDRLTPLAEACRQTWERRHQIRQALDGARDPRVLEDLFDLALFSIDLNRRLAATHVPPPQPELCVLDDAGAFFGPSRVLDDVRRRRGLGRSAPPHALDVAQTEWEHVTLARLALQADDLPAAAAHLEQALALAPHGFWPHYYHGLCAGRLGQHLEAVSSLSLCIGAAPDLAAIYYERALAYAALRQPDLAIRDYGRALQLDPTLGGAALNRGMLHFEAGRFTEAEKDLQHALSLGANPTHAHFELALVHRAQKQHGRARDHLLRVLSLRPDHAAARELLGQLSDAP